LIRQPSFLQRVVACTAPRGLVLPPGPFLCRRPDHQHQTRAMKRRQPPRHTPASAHKNNYQIDPNFRDLHRHGQIGSQALVFESEIAVTVPLCRIGRCAQSLWISGVAAWEQRLAPRSPQARRGTRLRSHAGRNTATIDPLMSYPRCFRVVVPFHRGSAGSAGTSSARRIHQRGREAGQPDQPDHDHRRKFRNGTGGTT
jgi:hypothetical protein